MRNTMTIEFLTFGTIKIWAESYGPEVCEILVPHCELVYKKEDVITVFKYRLSDRGETLLALTNQNFLAALRRSQARQAASLAALDSEYFRKENKQ